MPKVRNPATKYLKAYTEEDVENAILAISKGMCKKTAAKRFNIPRATLQFRLSSKFVKSKPGPTTILTVEEENTLVNWIITCRRKGFPHRKEDLFKGVRDFLVKHPRVNNFIDNTPGEGWYKLFMKRHPEITQRTSEAVTSACSDLSERQIRLWFEQIQLYLIENNLMHIFNDPSRILNLEETNFILCPENINVIAVKSGRNMVEIDSVRVKSCVTTMLAFSAKGKVLPPMLVFPFTKMRDDVLGSVPPEWEIGQTDNGWMQASTYCQYIKNVVHPALLRQNIQFPVILFVDGHKTNATLEMTHLCQELGIVMLAVYPNTPKILQPANLAALHPIRTLWKSEAAKWTIENSPKEIMITDVGPILQTMLPNIKDTILIYGFRTTGLCPLNPNEIDYSKCSVSNVKIGNPAAIINIQTFARIVGVDLMIKMQKNVVGVSREAQVLYEIYKQFSQAETESSGPDMGGLKYEIVTEITSDEEERKPGCEPMAISEQHINSYAEVDPTDYVATHYETANQNGHENEFSCKKEVETTGYNTIYHETLKQSIAENELRCKKEVEPTDYEATCHETINQNKVR